MSQREVSSYIDSSIYKCIVGAYSFTCIHLQHNENIRASNKMKQKDSGKNNMNYLEGICMHNIHGRRAAG